MSYPLSPANVAAIGAALLAAGFTWRQRGAAGHPPRAWGGMLDLPRWAARGWRACFWPVDATPSDAPPEPVDEATCASKLAAPAGVPAPAPPDGAKAGLPELVEQLLARERYAILLRPQIAPDISPRQIARAQAGLQAAMALVPAGDVQTHDPGPIGRKWQGHSRRAAGGTELVSIDAVYLDRHAVTNRQYRHFVADGGYGDLSLWDADIRPVVGDFVDATGMPGPSFWSHGNFPRGWDDHPVVGVNWYEATAFARWVGKRLPTDAEWIKAGTWPVTLSDGSRLQRAYPWGPAMDRSRANLWGSGPGSTVPVHSFGAGANPGGVQQLIGNVWEWTSGRFLGPSAYKPGESWNAAGSEGASLRSLRGGAFDTYFDSQATCLFQSGDHPLARKHNIGFRCAVGLCDLWSDPGSEDDGAEGMCLIEVASSSAVEVQR